MDFSNRSNIPVQKNVVDMSANKGHILRHFVLRLRKTRRKFMSPGISYEGCMSDLAIAFPFQMHANHLAPLYFRRGMLQLSQIPLYPDSKCLL